MLAPLQMGIPGGPELLVILLIMVLLFGVPLALVVGGFVLLRNRSGSDDRVEALESRVEELESELERERGPAGDDDRND